MLLRSPIIRSRFAAAGVLLLGVLFVVGGCAPQGVPGDAVERECFMILVGKDATTDGSVLLAHNNDLTGKEVSLIEKHPRQTHPSGSVVVFPSGLEIPQSDETCEWMVMRIAEGFEEGDAVAINEYQVAIAGGVALGRDRAGRAERADPLVKTGLTGGVRYIALQRAKTARECVEIVGDLYTEYGVTYPSGFGVADPNEIWYIESGGGRSWAAVRVPDDGYWVQANGYRIGVIDPADTVNVLVSPGLLEFCKKTGLWDPETGPFCFKSAFGGQYSKTPGKEFYNTRRVWRGMDLLSPSLGLDVEAGEFPMTAVPDKKVSLEALFAILRDHYEGTSFAAYTANGESLGERLIASPTCVHTDVIQMRGDRPVDIGAVLWAGLSRPSAAFYIPFYFGVREIPGRFACADTECGPAFDVFKRLSDALLADYPRRIENILATRSAFESAFLARQTSVEDEAADLFKSDPALGKDYLTQYVDRLCDDVLASAEQIALGFEKEEASQ